ncbi:major facilitator superfamily MFS_1 [Staphylothermus marinus F1]|uniref:Major facilitator superfamily MFS_1 n=1 Tax=Staphylothermus marinus (strain ATCC 43588 / DSM 3639 / JCM 9404 / F1) TaxID=399550 RepID=A3DPW9_STAMF|nr:major facilitator superfamily MFS_1 [Staphylothermus marinus F1]
MVFGVIVDGRSFYTAVLSVVVVMIVSGIVSPHISIKVLEANGLLWVSLLTLGFMSARAFSSILHAELYELLSARVTGSIGLGFILLSYILYSISPPILYPAIKLLEGFSAGLFWPLMQTLLVVGVDKNWRSRWLSIYFLVGNISGYAGYQIGSLIIQFWGSDKILYTGIIIGLIYLLLYIIISPSTRYSVEKRGKISFKTILWETRRIPALIPLVFLVGGVNGLLKDYLFAYAKVLTGYSEAVLRNYWSIAGYIGLTLSILFSHMLEAQGHTKTVLVISITAILSVIILPITTNPVIVFTIITLCIIGTRTLRPILRGLASNKTSKPEIGIALINSLANISAGITPFLIALVSIII